MEFILQSGASWLIKNFLHIFKSKKRLSYLEKAWNKLWKTFEIIGFFSRVDIAQEKIADMQSSMDALINASRVHGVNFDPVSLR